MLSNQLLSTVCMGIGAFVLVTIVVFLRVMDHYKSRHPMHSLRQLTIWNLLITGIFLMCVVALPPQTAFVLGVAVATNNLFVLLARSAMLPFKSQPPLIVFLDALSHYIIPVLAVALVMLKAHTAESCLMRQMAPSPLTHVWKSLLAFLAVLVLWFFVNLLLYHKTGTWAYGGKVGHVRHMSAKQAGWLLAAIAASFGISVGLTAGTLNFRQLPGAVLALASASAAVVVAGGVVWLDGKLRHRWTPMPALEHADIHVAGAATPAAMAETLARSGKVLVKHVGLEDKPSNVVRAARAHTLFGAVIGEDTNLGTDPVRVPHCGFKDPGSAYVSVYGRQPKTNVTDAVYMSTSLGRHVPIGPHTEFHFSMWQPRRIAFYAGKMTTPVPALFPAKPHHETTLIDVVDAAAQLKTKHGKTWNKLGDARVVTTATFPSWDAVLDAWNMESEEEVRRWAAHAGITVRVLEENIELETVTPFVKRVQGGDALSLNTDLLGPLHYRELMLHSDKQGLLQRLWACAAHWFHLRGTSKHRVVTSRLWLRGRVTMTSADWDALWAVLSNRVTVQWERGDLLIVDNERFAHAKPPASSGGDRELMVMYGDWTKV